MSEKPAPAKQNTETPAETVRHEKKASIELDALRARNAAVIADATKTLESLVPEIVAISDSQVGAIRKVCEQLRALTG